MADKLKNVVLKFKAKDDRVFIFLNYSLMKAYLELKNEKMKKIVLKDGKKVKEVEVKPSLIEKIKRSMFTLTHNVNLVVKAFKKDFGEAVKEERITVDFETKEKGGIVIIDAKAKDKEEYKKWTKLNWREKLGMKSIKKWIEVEINGKKI